MRLASYTDSLLMQRGAVPNPTPRAVIDQQMTNAAEIVTSCLLKHVFNKHNVRFPENLQLCELDTSIWNPGRLSK